MTAHGELKNWKRMQVVSVATDPAFPDPRVTAPPRPTQAPYTPPPYRPTPIPEVVSLTETTANSSSCQVMGKKLSSMVSSPNRLYRL